MDLIIFIVLVIGGYFIGTSIEKSHYKEIKMKEKAFLDLPCVTLRKCLPGDTTVEESKLVFGSVVISGDYFKLVLASILTFFGGRLIGYESLIDRGRREAVIRMKTQAKVLGADLILNTRFETTNLDANKGGTGMFEILVFGTALRLKKS